MEPTNRKIQALVDMYLSRELLLPEMQRKYVWRATQVRDLIDSIYRDYPSGAILIWETANLPVVKASNIESLEQKPIGKQLLLLDGQQRITSLACVLTGKPIRIREGNKIKEKFVDIIFNVDHPDNSFLVTEEEANYEIGDMIEAKWEDDGDFYVGRIAVIEGTRYYIHYEDGDEGWSDEVRDLGQESKRELFFRLKNRAIENKPNWISVTKLFKEGVGSILREMKIGANDTNFDKFNQRLNLLYNRKENYLYPIQILRDKPYSEVTDVFIRVNSSGTRLRSSDLAIAQITSIWPGSMHLFEEFVDECSKRSFFLNENFFVRCIVCIATNQPKFDNLGRITLSDYKSCWELTKKGIRCTIDFLINNAFTDSSVLIPSTLLLIPIIVYAAKKDLCASHEIEKSILYWFFNAAIWGRYSGSSETRLAEDLNAFKSNNPWLTLINNLWQTVGKKRQIMKEDIRGKGINSPIFYAMYVIARSNKARDLETGSIVNFTNMWANNFIQYDHVFPKSKLEIFLKDKCDSTTRKRTINEIANMAFMTKKGNVIKSNDDPIDYFPKVVKKHGGTHLFEMQQIPYEENILKYELFEDFLNKRAELLSNSINAFLRQYDN